MSEDQNIKNLISNIFKSKGALSKGYNQFTVEQVWRETFGEMISSYTSSVRFSKGTLTVYITSSPLKQELMITKENVISRMNQNLPYHKISKLVIR